jgi:hypothetical protein
MTEFAILTLHLSKTDVDITFVANTNMSKRCLDSIWMNPGVAWSYSPILNIHGQYSAERCVSQKRLAQQSETAHLAMGMPV